MAVPPKAITLRKEDYRDAPGNDGWLGRLFTQLNEHLTSVTTALTRGLTRAENMRSTVKTITFTGGGPIAVKHDLAQRPVDVWVGRLQVLEGTAIGSGSAWSMTWDHGSDGNLSVSFQGLNSTTRYEARLVIE